MPDLEDPTVDLVDTSSLAATVDAVSDALFFGREVTKAERTAAARWIAGRQGLPGSYANMFALTERDRGEGVRLFTGESVGRGAAAAHILGEESCRALIELDVPFVGAREALGRATEGMLERLRKAERRESNCGRPWLGQYCCGRCSVGLWRHLAVGGLEDAGRHLAAGMKALKAHRLGNGRWRRFPFHYTVLLLSEIDVRGALGERRYAAPVLERLLKRTPRDDPHHARRRAVTERVLARC
jgi:hypothetical protein